MVIQGKFQSGNWKYKRPIKYIGLSTDTRPANAKPGDEFFVSDTGAVEVYSEDGWGEVAVGPGTTWDSANKGANQVLSNGDLTVTGGVAVAFETCRATVGKNDHEKFYFEVEVAVAAGDEFFAIGIAEDDHALDNWLGSSNSGWSVFVQNGGTEARYHNGGGVFDQVNSMALVDGDVVMVACEFAEVNGEIWFGKNGTWYGAAGDNPDPANGVDPAFNNITDSGGASGLLFPACSTRESTNSLTLVTKLADFNHTPPSGFSAWG